MPDDIRSPTESNPTPFKKAVVPLSELLLGIFLPSLIMAVSGLMRLFYLPGSPWSEGYLRFFMLFFFSLVLFLYAVAVCKKRGLWPLFRRASAAERLPMLFASLVIALGIQFGLGAAHLILEKIFNQRLEMPDYSALATAGPNSLLSVLMILAGFTAVPVLEEIYFRGFLYNALKTRLPILSAATLQAALFAAAHGAGLIVSILYFLAGLALTAIYEKGKDLTFPVLVHGFINSIALFPLLLMALQNFHMPASNWEEAKISPAWLTALPFSEIERKEDGMKQWQYAIDTWGSPGFKAWKKEANAFNAVCAWFPEDRAACAKAKIGVISIYIHSLKDYRRGIVEAEQLISKFSDREEEMETAFAKQGLAFLMLQDFERSRQSYEKVMNGPHKNPAAQEEAEKGMKLLNRIEATARHDEGGKKESETTDGPV
jgi:membrane protease YdiL (CAAX protease family)